MRIDPDRRNSGNIIRWFSCPRENPKSLDSMILSVRIISLLSKDSVVPEANWSIIPGVAAIYHEDAVIPDKDSSVSSHFCGYIPLYATTLISQVLLFLSNKVVENSVFSPYEYVIHERYGDILSIMVQLLYELLVIRISAPKNGWVFSATSRSIFSVSCRITRNPVADNTRIKNSTEIDLIFRVKIREKSLNIL